MSMLLPSDKSEEIKRADVKSYAKSAGSFARLTERFSDSIADHMLDLSGIDRGYKVLDIGTGSGLVAIKAATRGNNIHVTGIDQSEEMLEQARVNSKLKGLEKRTSFILMDAEALKMADAEFDVVTSLYVLRHLPDPLKALGEAFRVLKNGRHAVIAIGASPSLFSKAGMRAGFNKIQDRFLELANRRAVAPGALRRFLEYTGVGPEVSHAKNHLAGDLAEMCNAVGFVNVRSHWFSQSFDLTPPEFWDVQAVFDSDARSRIAPLKQSEMKELRGRFLDRCHKIVERGGRLIYRTGAEIYVAER